MTSITPSGDGSVVRVDSHGSDEAISPEAVGRTLKRLRQRAGVSLQTLAAETNLSASFLSMLERGETDVSLGRLARLADYFGHDVGSFLGYTQRRSLFAYMSRSDRVVIERGKGIEYDVFRVPGLEMELVLVRFAPHSAFDEPMAHDGVDTLFVLEGELDLIIGETTFTVRENEGGCFSALHPHTLRNRTDFPAVAIAIASERIF